MGDGPVIYGVLTEGGLLYRGLKSGSGAANNAAQQIGVIANVPPVGSGTAWELQLWINCATDNAYSGAHYVGARARQGETMFTNIQYNFTTNAALLPTTTVTVDSGAGTITMALTAATTADGVVSYQVRYEFRVLSASPITGTPPTIA